MNNLLTKLAGFFALKKTRPRSGIQTRTTDYQADLSEEDLRLFNALSQFVWVQGEPIPLIFDVNHEIYMQHGINVNSLQRLAEIGLVTVDSSGFVKKKLGKHTRLFYCGRPTKIGFTKDENNQLDLGHVLLTERGKAMVQDQQIVRNQVFYEYVINYWFSQGYLLSSIQVDQLSKMPSIE